VGGVKSEERDESERKERKSCPAEGKWEKRGGRE
jgi:hypothetical protein